MKKLIIIALLVLGMGNVYAESTTYTVAKGMNWTFKARVSETDTVYMFLFRNAKYQYIVDYEGFSMTKGDLEEFYHQTDRLFAGQFGDKKLSFGVDLHAGTMSKSLWYKSAYCYITPSVIKRMKKGQAKTGF